MTTDTPPIRTYAETLRLLHYGAWHDPETPPRMYCQPDPDADLAGGENGENVSEAFVARYDPLLGWSLIPSRQVWATHGATAVSWLGLGFGRPGRPTHLIPGVAIRFHFALIDGAIDDVEPTVTTTRSDEPARRARCTD